MSNQLEAYDFLKKDSDEPIRQEAKNILSSYSQVYDVLAESMQNAVDAVEERYYQEPLQAVAKIMIVFNAQERSISVTDTGTGMPWEVLRSAPCPNITNKRKNQLNSQSNTYRSKHSRGEKGVGLSFLTFICNELRVRTCDGERTVEAVITNANDWINEKTTERPLLKPTSADAEPPTESFGSKRYTQLVMKDVSTDYMGQDIFDLSVQDLIYILRTKTAIGHTEPVIFDRTPEPDIEVTLQYIDGDGKSDERRVSYKYLSPEEYITEASKITYERFRELDKKGKLNSARGKALIYRDVKKTSGGRPINCYAFIMAPNEFRAILRDLELEQGLTVNDWAEIDIATRGMPTGISVEHPITYSAGYWQRIFILLQDDEMNFDVGRKSLQGRSKPMMQAIAKEIWDDVTNYLQQLTPAVAEAVTRQKQGQLIHLFEEAQQWPNLDFNRVQFLKQPKLEQMVVALFYELVGASVLKGYRTLRNNTMDQYDAFIAYRIDKREIGRFEASKIKKQYVEDRIIIEFKYDAEGILRDLNDNSKRYRDINLLVCWQIDSARFEREGIEVMQIPQESVYYYGSTHLLYFPGIYQVGENLAVIELKTFLEQFKEKNP